MLGTQVGTVKRRESLLCLKFLALIISPIERVSVVVGKTPYKESGRTQGRGLTLPLTTIRTLGKSFPTRLLAPLWAFIDRVNGSQPRMEPPP
jgi:hypothetical protein